MAFAYRHFGAMMAAGYTRKSTLILGFLCALTLSSCGSQETQAPLQFIGGEPVTPGLFPGFVAIEDCGATKVGSHYFLTAAHCVLYQQKNTLAPQFVSNGEFALYTLDSKTPRMMKAERTWVVYSRAKKLDDVHKDKSAIIKEINKTDYDRVEDIALIKVKTTTPGISIAEISTKPLDSGDSLFATGWGRRYEEPYNSAGSILTAGPFSEPHYASTKIHAVSELYYTAKRQRNKYGEISESIAPGDSGSGSYVKEFNLANLSNPWQTKVVAVNSFADNTKFNVSRITPRLAHCINERISGKIKGNFSLPGQGFAIICATPESYK